MEYMSPRTFGFVKEIFLRNINLALARVHNIYLSQTHDV